GRQHVRRGDSRQAGAGDRRETAVLQGSVASVSGERSTGNRDRSEGAAVPVPRSSSSDPVPRSPFRLAILTISDAGARGERVDTSGDTIEAWARARSASVAARTLVSDDSVPIVATLTAWCDGDVADLVLTTGGTGLSPRDIT